MMSRRQSQAGTIAGTFCPTAAGQKHKNHEHEEESEKYQPPSYRIDVAFDAGVCRILK